MTTYRVTCIPGDGIGPEIMAAAKVAVAATGVQIEWIDVEAGADVMDKYGTPLPQAVIDSVRDTKVAIKGPITTPVGSGFRSVNVGLRKGAGPLRQPAARRSASPACGRATRTSTW